MDPREDFLKSTKLKEFQSHIREGHTLLIESLWEGPKGLLLHLAQKAIGKHIVILSGTQKENYLFDDLSYFSDVVKPLEFPAWESLPTEEIPPSPDVVGERYHILREIQNAKDPLILFTTLQAIFQKVLSPTSLHSLHLIIRKGTKIPFSSLPHKLSEMGYHRKIVASDKAEFAVRGGIIDIFPVSAKEPYRIEFFEDEIVSIRKYDPVGQVSVGKIDEITITPGEEMELLSQQESVSLFDYLGDNTLLVFDDIALLEDKYVSLQEMLSPSRLLCSLDEILEKTAHLQKIYFASSSLEKLSQVKILGKVERPYSEKTAAQEISFELFNKTFFSKRWNHPFFPLLPTFCPHQDPAELSTEIFFQELEEMKPQILFLCTSESEENALKKKLSPYLLENSIFERGYLSSGFYLKEPPLAFIAMAEFTHRYKVRREKQRSHYHTLPFEMMDLTPGDAIVHLDNGIGKYLGIEKKPNHLGIETEYLHLGYAQNANLYVPIDQTHLVSKYIGATEELPELNTLGSSKWKRARKRTEEAILGYAKDLLKVQAQRALQKGEGFSSDSDLIKQFAGEFAYEETVDQLQTMEKISEDLRSQRLMDRLVCGDVGYGKTEVAIRAAFKTVADGGKQVAILVPTTVLAMQHFETFSERMENFPINVGLLCRFIKPKEARETINKTAEGSVDILIGTHRILSSDISFKDLGLIIIDEEQRFGVRAKEHLKALKKDVHCLTLSATPIPRTLYLSLAGARDLSTINTPPDDRLPIQTIVCQKNDEIIKNALLRELARDGQVFIIHNRIETIYRIAQKIRELLPQAKVVVGHGQMHSQELDLVFHAFKSGKADILVATTIIENGIDIPNANTILIDDADRFGLADLYQMRGRVGRWNRKAYCYFLISNLRELSEIARKRLSVLSQIKGHGGGMKIAMHDLEIRGAGNILGTEQSGHISSIGFHLYCKLLKKTIASYKDNTTPLLFQEIKIEFPFPARITEHYIEETALRMEIYQRLGDAEKDQDIDELIEEVIDRYGPLPEEVKWLQSIAKIRLFALKNHFSLLKIRKVVLHAEQDFGKKNKIVRKIIIANPQSPKELESIVLTALKENFPLKEQI